MAEAVRAGEAGKLLVRVDVSGRRLQHAGFGDPLQCVLQQTGVPQSTGPWS
jgi:hypothetical protein